jgi:hypothetical protein
MSTKNSSANNTLFSKERNIVHGRPRHPQSQGFVERANVDVKEMLATWLSENPGFVGDVVYHEQCSSPLKTGYCLQRNFSSTYQEFHCKICLGYPLAS